MAIFSDRPLWQKVLAIFLIIVLIVLISTTLIFRKPQAGRVEGVTTQVAESTPVIYGGGGPTLAAIPTTPPVIYTTQTNYYKGAFLGDYSGRSLYIYDGDRYQISNCNEKCTSTWVPYSPTVNYPGYLPANITIIKRSDGTEQYAWFGKPLYYYSGDKVRGDILGDGINGFHLAPP